MRVLLVKTSSLGDIIHNLPVVSDIRTRLPGAIVDWVVEDGFVDLPRLHPGVNRVIPVALRRWRQSLLRQATWRDIGKALTQLRADDYDLILDTQGLLKSALLASRAHGPRAGFGPESAREPIACRYYQKHYTVARDQHAVLRNRQLAGLALGYALPEQFDYGIASPGSASHNIASTPTAILLTATSRADKQWPDASWIELGSHLARRGLRCLLPAGSAAEHQRAGKIAAAIPDATTLPATGLGDLARQLAAAHLVIGVDTGLVHLATALGRPTIALFCASDPELTGVLAASNHPGRAFNLGRRGAAPAVSDVLTALVALA